jgi:hypothetical protein
LLELQAGSASIEQFRRHAVADVTQGVDVVDTLLALGVGTEDVDVVIHWGEGTLHVQLIL